MKHKIEKLVHRVATDVQQLSDPRLVGQVVFVIIVLLVSWSGIKSIQTNYTLQQRIGELRQQNEVQNLKNLNIKLENNYYNSSQYLELSARQSFGLAAPGEKELLVPAEVADSYVADLPKPKPVAELALTTPDQPNPRAWLDFFLHRSTN